MGFYDSMKQTYPAGGSSYFSYSPETRDLLSRLRNSSSRLTQYPAGMSPSERNAVMNQMVERIKAGEAPELESTRIRMARQGLTGSGIEGEEINKVKRGYSEAVSSAQRDLAIDEAQRRANETIASAGAANALAGTVMGGETSEEAVNAARRAEGTTAQNNLLQLLQLLYGAQASTIAPYAQAVMTQYGGGGGMDSSGLALLPYLLMGNR